MKPTEGPYTAEETGDGSEWFVYAKFEAIAHCYNGASDARLLAKSWEMREALQALVDEHGDENPDDDWKEFKRARAILREIEGESE